MADLNSRVESYSNGADQSVTEIIIVRHGETDWNVLRKMQGQADIDLNELGRHQANAVADRLSRESDISAIYTSDLKRAFDTANTIASTCGGIQVIADQDLREKDLGVLQGQIYDPQQLKIHFPQVLEALKSEDQEVPGGGENRKQLYERVTSAVQRIGDKHKGERVVVVSHGAVIVALHKRACPGGHAGDIRNASIGILHLSDGGLCHGDHHSTLWSNRVECFWENAGEQVVVVSHGALIEVLYKRACPGAKVGGIRNASIGILHLSDGGVWSVKAWNDYSHLNQTGIFASGFGGNGATA